jgi:hypothetical protein
MTATAVSAPAIAGSIWAHTKLLVVLAIAFVALAAGFFAIGRATSGGASTPRGTTVQSSSLDQPAYVCQIGRPC